MLRGLATINYFADDLTAARDWYTRLLGTEPYFVRELDGRLALEELDHPRAVLQTRLDARFVVIRAELVTQVRARVVMVRSSRAWRRRATAS